MPEWVQLTGPEQITHKGSPVNHVAGEWVEVGRQAAQDLIARGRAISPKGIASGIDVSKYVIVSSSDEVRQWINQTLPGLKTFSKLPPDNKGFRVLHLAPGSYVNPLFIIDGFRILDNWDAAIPVMDYRQLACHIGDKAEQEKTQEVIRDLRVPVYDWRVVFSKGTNNAKELLRTFATEAQTGNKYLAMLRAIYKVKPYLLPLPQHWIAR